MARHLQVNPAAADLASSPSATLLLGADVSGNLQWKTPMSVGPAGITGTKQFYSAATSGGTVNVLNTVVISSGIITSWTQTTSGGGKWDFADANMSHHILTAGL